MQSISLVTFMLFLTILTLLLISFLCWLPFLLWIAQWWQVEPLKTWSFCLFMRTLTCLFLEDWSLNICLSPTSKSLILSLGLPTRTTGSCIDSTDRNSSTPPLAYLGSKPTKHKHLLTSNILLFYPTLCLTTVFPLHFSTLSSYLQPTIQANSTISQ